MAKVNQEQQMNTIFQSIPLIRRYPSDHIWIDYDRSADVLYMNFERPQRATDSVLKDDVLVRSKNGKVIGLTVLNASKFRKA